MPKKDDEDCGCTGSIDLEKTTKNINLNIVKQTRNKKLKSATDHKTDYPNKGDCSSIAQELKLNVTSCEDVCKMESKRLHNQALNCDGLNKKNIELNAKNKKAEKNNENCRKEAKKLFGNNTKVQNCGQLGDECKNQAKKKFGRKMNCSIYKREIKCTEDAIKEFGKAYGCDELDRQKACIKNAKGIFGSDTDIKSCKQLENKIAKEKDLGRRIEKARFDHMTKKIKGTKFKEDGTEVEAFDQNGAKLRLKGGDIFIQTYDMGENILVDGYNIWTLKKDGKIKEYLTKNMNMPDYSTYKEFIEDYFKNEVFRHQDYKEYNTRSNLIEILDMRGGFKDKERMDFDLAGEYFRERVNLRKVTISNADGLSPHEEKWAEYAEYDFKKIPGDISDPIKTRGKKDARFLTIPYHKDHAGFTKEAKYRYKDYNTSPRVCAIQEKAGSYIGLTPYKQKWKTAEDQYDKQENRRIEKPKDWIPSLNHLFKIHEKKITSDIWVFNKRTDMAKGDKDLNKIIANNHTVLNYMSPLRPKNEFKHDGTYKQRFDGYNLGNGLARFYTDLFPINSRYFGEIGYAQCFSRNRWTRGTTPDWAWGMCEGGKMDNVFYPRLKWGWGFGTFWNVGEVAAQNAGLIYNSNYRRNETSFKSPEHYFTSILYNKHYVWAKDIINFSGPAYENKYGMTKYRTFDMPISANLVDFLDIEVMSDKPLYCCKRNADTLWDHHFPYEWEIYPRDCVNLLNNIDKNGINTQLKNWNKDRAWKRNKTNYKDAYSPGSAIETNFDDIMKELRDTYNTEVGNEADDSITPYDFRRYWSSKLNFRNEPFVLGTRPFKGCTNLQVVKLQLRKIKTGGVHGTFDQYFMDLKNLHTVHLPDSIEATGKETFKGCSRLNELAMPGVRTISERTFQGCEGLTQFTINGRMNFIHGTAFIGCTRLEKLIIKNRRPDPYKFETFVGDDKPKIQLIELGPTAFVSDHGIKKLKLLNQSFFNNFNHSLKRIIFPKDLKYRSNMNFKYFHLTKTFVDGKVRKTYYKDLSILPDFLLEDLSNEKFFYGVKTVGLNINPSKLPDGGYFTLKTRQNKYNLFGPHLDSEGASYKFRDYDLNNLDLSGELLKLTNFNTYDILYNSPPILHEDYVIKVNRSNKKMIIGPGVNLTKADLTDVNLNGTDITNINFKNAIFKNVIATNVKINTKGTNIGHKVFEKNNQKFLLGPGLYFDKFDFSEMSFQNLILSNCVFRNCNFTSTDFRKADLTNCSLINCNLTKASINNRTILKGLKSNALTYNNVNFNHEKYKFYGKNGNGILIGPKVDLSNQNLSDFDLSNSNMTQVTIHKTIINDNTILPNNIKRSQFINK